MRRCHTSSRLLLSRGVCSEIRLYAPAQPLAAHATVSLADEQRHYLANVMRAKAGSEILIFNGIDGEWVAAIEQLDKRVCACRIVERCRPQPDAAPAPVLLFGVLKGARLPALRGGWGPNRVAVPRARAGCSTRLSTCGACVSTPVLAASRRRRSWASARCGPS